MRVTILKCIFLFVTTSFLSAKEASAQEILDRQVTLNVKDITLKAALRQLENATRVRFSYSRNIINLNQTVNINAESEVLAKVLQRLLNPLAIDYQVVDDQILLYNTKKKSSNLNEAVSHFAIEDRMLSVQYLAFQGRVISAVSGQGLPDVSVQVKNTNFGTTTDKNGSFSLNIPNGNAILILSYVGFLTKEISVNNQSFLEITLNPDVKIQDEVVVVGYGTQKRKDLTGSISSVNAATIEKIPVVSLDQALQGRAAGVQVTNNDGAPGGNISVLIRGVGSLASGGNNPLYVVDGYPLEGGINNINPSDIATIDVLKDASATAIYGIRAANGVVIVTTKKGRKDGGVQISVDAYSAFQGEPQKYKVLNAQQFATLANDVAANDPQQNFKVFDAWKTPSSLTNVDWQNALYRSGLTQNYSVALRGGNDKVQTSASFGYFGQKGIVVGSYFKRFTLGLNLDYAATKWLKSSTSIKYSNQNANNPFGTGSLVQLTQLPPTLDGGNKLTNQITDGNGFGFYNPIYTYVAKHSNPLYGINNNEYRNLTNYVLASSSLEATIIKGLKVRTNGGVNISNYNGAYYQPEDNRLVAQYGSQAGASQNASASQSLDQSFDWVWENTISYDKIYRQHNVNVLGGVSAQKNTFNHFGGSGIPPNSVIRDLSRFSNLKLDANGQTIQTLASTFARLTYQYADRYIVTGTLRRDGSSKFDTGAQYGVFPSASVAWKLKNESFMQNVSWLHDIKLRGSYGVVGNQSPIGAFQYQALYQTGTAAITSGNLGYPFNKLFQNGIAQSQPANPNLKWETDYQTDIGIDASFLHGDLTVTIDWFKRRSKDFLLKLDAPAQSGYEKLTRNVGEMENRGLEFAANYNHSIRKDLFYSVGLTLTTINNKLTKLTSGANSIGNFGGLSLSGIGWSDFTQTNVGGSVGDFFGYKSLGIFQSETQIDALNAKSPSGHYQYTANGAGDRYYADINGDGQVTADDRVSLGSPLPKFFSGLNLDVNYKAWDANAFFYGVFGNKILSYVESTLQSFQNRTFVGVQNVSEEYYNNRWTTTNSSNTYSKANYNDDVLGNNVPSSAWVQDGSFVKLKNLTIGYSFAPGWIKKITATKLRAYISTQNLFTITKYKGLDPEIGLQGGNATQNGIDNGTYPSSRFATVGINVVF